MGIYTSDPVVLLDALATTGSSQWVNISDFDAKNLDVRISATATVQVMLSNEVSQPASSSDAGVDGSNVTSTSMVAVTTAARWLKVKVTATTGTVSVYMFGNFFENTEIA